MCGFMAAVLRAVYFSLEILLKPYGDTHTQKAPGSSKREPRHHQLWRVYLSLSSEFPQRPSLYILGGKTLAVEVLGVSKPQLDKQILQFWFFWGHTGFPLDGSRADGLCDLRSPTSGNPFLPKAFVRVHIERESQCTMPSLSQSSLLSEKF